MKSSFEEIYSEFRMLAKNNWDLWAKQFQKEKLEPSFFPLWLKRQSKKGLCEEYWSELADLVWSKHWVDENEGLESKESGSYLLVNPLARILRFEYDIVGWISSSSEAPKVLRQILIASSYGAHVASFEMAALIDELSDEPQKPEMLLTKLESRNFAHDGQSVNNRNDVSWSAALDRLIELGVVIRGKV